MLPLGTASYNGYSFGPEAKITAFRATPQYDAAGRTVVYTVFLISILDRIYAANGVSTDAQMDALKLQLNVPGGALIFTGKGAGILNLNIAGPRDVVWGPKPRGIEQVMLGRDQAWQFIWTVELAVPQQCLNPAYMFSLMEVNFDVSYTIDRDQYTTRNFKGFLRIPQTRATVNTRTLQDTADNYRRNILPVCPDDFWRTTENFALDASKCRLDINVVDEEMAPNKPPPGIIEVDANHNVSSAGSATTMRWTSTITARYKVAKDRPRSLAYTYFVRLMTSRALFAVQNAWDGFQQAGGTVLLVHFSANESLYSRNEVSFSATLTFVTTLQTIMAASGLFMPIPDSDYQQWRASLANTMFSQEGRGWAFLRFNPNDDLIIDLCQPNVGLTSSGSGQPSTPFFGNPQLGLANSYPDPRSSFIDYQCWVRIEQEDHIVELKPLPQQPPLTPQPANVLTTLPELPNIKDPTRPIGPAGGQLVNSIASLTQALPPGTVTTVPQTRTNPTYYIRLWGYGVRAGYAVAPPTLVTAGGVPCVPANRSSQEYVQSAVIANWYGVPISGTMWNLRWLLPEVPGPIGLPPNPVRGGG